MSRMSCRAFIGLGSSAGDPPTLLASALRALDDAGERIAAVSRAVWSPFDDESGHTPPGTAPVLNAVAELRTHRRPDALLDLLLSVESAHGRDRSHGKGRTLDLDLLDAGEEHHGGGLDLPHPRALERAFVLAPWEEVAPLHVVTGTGLCVVEHAATLRARHAEAFGSLEVHGYLPWPDYDTRCQVLEDADAITRWRDGQIGSVGVVPTMGALHEGHASALRRARAECDAVVATLFVNPLQFGEGEDLDRYPRTLETDLALLGRAGADAVYVPGPGDLYPAGFGTYVVPEGPAQGLEGSARPGHFRGVATVVYKLWCRARPDRAYFGRKDAQQLAVIRRMVEDLELGGEVVPVPTVRDADGLALSSRNRYLSGAERVRALGLSRVLEEVALAAADRGVGVDALRAMGARNLREAELDVEYFEIVDAETMTPLDGLDRPALAVSAVRAGRTRLLDNRWLARAVAGDGGVRKA